MSFRLNPALQAQWRAAIGELASIAKKDDPESIQKLVTLSARRFVRNVADITPPATGKADSIAKKRGEAAILRDLLKIAIPTTVAGPSHAAREVLASAEDLLTAHATALSAGTVDRRKVHDKLFVSPTTFNRVLALLQKRVGWLAAGLNAAAARLGASLPAWIKRHGNRFGRIEVHPSRHGLRIRIIQNVPFADDVKNYARHWNFALQKEIASLTRQARAIFERKAGRAKARLRR